MDESTSTFKITVQSTTGKCPRGEKAGKENMADGSIPVLSCEGACIRGEIARRAANIIARENGFARGCHGEFLAVPHSAIHQWLMGAEKVVLIDGCFLKCHGRMFQDQIPPDRLKIFDANTIHKKYNDIFIIDDVPDDEINAAASLVATTVLEKLASSESSEKSECQDCTE